MGASGGPKIELNGLKFILDVSSKKSVSAIGMEGWNGAPQAFKNIINQSQNIQTISGSRLGNVTPFTIFAIDYPEGNYGGAAASREGIQQGFNVTSDTEFASGNYTTRYFTENNAGAEEVAYQKAQSYSLEGGGNILQSNQVTLQRQRPATQGIGSRMDLTSRITDSVALYLPSEIGNSTSTKYQGAELGMLGYLALGGADLLGQLQNRDFAGMGDTAVGMIDAAITEGLKKSAVTAADLFSGASTQGSIDKVFGQTVNPFIEVAFESMGVRSFEYTFNFTPKSKEETEEVKAIIQLFRFHMVPELKGTNHRYLTLPSTFDIHYMYQSSPEVTKENTYYNKIATCVLEDCNVNYAPTGVKSFDDGAPTQITMTLRFMETEMLTKEKVNKGF